MSCVGFKPTIPASERAKTVHASDRSATVTGRFGYSSIETNQSSDWRSAKYCQKEQWYTDIYPEREKYDESQFHNMPLLGTPRESVLEITQND
jgi:hypothetical protein